MKSQNPVIDAAGYLFGAVAFGWAAITIARALLGGYIPWTPWHMEGSLVGFLFSFLWAPTIAALGLGLIMAVVSVPFVLAGKTRA